MHYSVLQRVAMRCDLCIAVCCSVLQYVAACYDFYIVVCCSVLQGVVMCKLKALGF